VGQQAGNCFHLSSPGFRSAVATNAPHR
jgi:hypothetical protein